MRTGAVFFGLFAFAALLFIALPAEYLDRRSPAVQTTVFYGRDMEFNLLQEFHSRSDNLQGIILAVENPGGRVFTFRVKEGNESVAQGIFSEPIPGMLKPLRFEPINDSSNKFYALEILAPPPRNGPAKLGFLGSDKAPPQAGRLFANGIDTSGSLFLRPLHGASLSEKLGLVTERVSAGGGFFRNTLIVVFSLASLLFSAALFAILTKGTAERTARSGD